MVRITKDGVFFDSVNIDEAGNETLSTIDVLGTPGLGLISYMSFPVTIEDGITVKDIMDMLASNGEAVDVAFDSSLSGQPFAKFHAEMLAEPTAQMYSYVEIAHESDPIEANELFSTVRMRGVGSNGELFSVEFAPVSDYRDMVVRLNTTYTINMLDNSGKEKKVLSVKKDFTLYEIVHAMLFEMSYYGDASDRAEAFEKVKFAVGVDHIEGFRLNDRQDVENLQNELQRAIDKEDYEKAAELRDKIKQMMLGEQNGENKI